jgi:hypothetical protein
MEINERDLLLTLADTVRKLANAVALSHAQLEALRTVVIGVHGALYGMPELQGRIEQSLGGSIEGDFGHAPARRRPAPAPGMALRADSRGRVGKGAPALACVTRRRRLAGIPSQAPAAPRLPSP